MSYYLTPPGERLFGQFNRRWKNRDHASDGWIGDASHQARPSDHNPDWSAGGIVRAIDVDVDLDKDDRGAMLRVVKQLAAWEKRRARKGKRAVFSYIIFDQKIWQASSGWEPRTYTGDNPHTAHAHFSFAAAADTWDGRFDIAIFDSALYRLLDELRKIRNRISNRLIPRRKRVNREIDRARREAKKVRSNIEEHREK
jgi:hypothetical protein